MKVVGGVSVLTGLLCGIQVYLTMMMSIWGGAHQCHPFDRILGCRAPGHGRISAARRLPACLVVRAQQPCNVVDVLRPGLDCDTRPIHHGPALCGLHARPSIPAAASFELPRPANADH